MPHAINVWRELRGGVQYVGDIAERGRGLSFRYDAGYDGEAVSVLLPVSSEAFSAAATAGFFSALIPEGAAREELGRVLRAGRNEFAPFLEGLRDESVGALLFSTGMAEPYTNPSYEAVTEGFFERLSARPLETAVETMGRTRLSLSGAMAKVGLYRDPSDGSWHFPRGGAPSTHIVKAADGERFPLETVNEALCLRTAATLGFPAAECELIPTRQGEPLLAARRFDRDLDASWRSVDGHVAPLRLHQEDFAQASGVALKYEPTDGSYLSLLLSVAGKSCANSFGEAHLAFEYTLFDFLIGNCDNHLKNYALLYGPDWKTREMAPLYDIVSTVMYPGIYLEMGVSFGGDRRIDHVGRSDILRAAGKAGQPEAVVASSMEELASGILPALESAASTLEAEGFTQVRQAHETISLGIKSRMESISG